MKNHRPIWLLLFLFALTFAGCGSSDDDDDDAHPSDDDQSDDDVQDDDSGDDDQIDDDSGDDDQADDDQTDDDSGDDDIVTPNGWYTPCDVDGDLTPDYLVEDYYTDEGKSMVSLMLKNTDGDMLHTIGPTELGSNGFGLNQMSDIDGDGLCEVIAVQQRIDLTDKLLKVDGRVQVLKGTDLEAVYDSGWMTDVYTFIQVATDITGDGVPDLVINNRPENENESGWIEAIDATDSYASLWTIDGDDGEGFNLLARAITGSVAGACGDPDGPDAFLLERYDLFDDVDPQWSAAWIDREGNELSGYGPIDLRQPGIKSGTLMHLDEEKWQCAGVIAYPVRNLFGGRYVIFDRDGDELFDGELGDVTTLYANASVSLDGNLTPDLVLNGNQSDGAPKLWVASDQDDYEATLVATGLASGSYNALSARLLPWLSGPVDITGARVDNFAVLPNSQTISSTLSVPLYGTDLDPTGFSYAMPLPDGTLIYATGYFLNLNGQGDWALVVSAIGYEGSPTFAYNSAWAVFQGDGSAPVHLEDDFTGMNVYMCTPWDFDGDDKPEICELYYPDSGGSAGRVRLVEPMPGFATMLTVDGEASHRVGLVGAWK